MPEKCILLKDTNAHKQTKKWNLFWSWKLFEFIYRGSLLVKLTNDEVRETSPYFAVPLNYKMYSDDSIKLCCKPDQVLQLDDEQFNMFLGVKDIMDRCRALNILHWVRQLKVGHGASVTIPTTPQPVTGVVRYIGLLPDEDGTRFGIELLVSKCV